MDWHSLSRLRSLRSACAERAYTASREAKSRGWVDVMFHKWFRYGACYAFTVHHPTSGRQVCGYVGKTRRKPSIRKAEHMNGRPGSPPKPWADTVVRFKVIYSSPRVSTFGLWWREISYIRRLRPLYNIQYRSRRNIPPWVAIEQRRERDLGIVSRRYERRTMPEMGIRRLPDGSWESYGRVHAWTGD